MNRLARAIAATALLAACMTTEQVGRLPADEEPDARPDEPPMALACTEPVPCFAPVGDRVTLCGQLYDVESRAAMRDADAEGFACDPLSPAATGPCSVCANAFSIVELVGGAAAARPLDSASIKIDDCGRYRFIGVERTDDGVVAVMTGNCSHPSRWVPTVVSIPVALGERVRDEPIYAASIDTMEMWTESAGRPFEPEQSFADVGASLVTYLHGTDPSRDVVLTVSGRPTRAFYFADDPALSSIDVSRAATGLNGSALAVSANGFSLYGGVGGEPDGCVWPSEIAAAIPGALFVQRKHATQVGASGGACGPLTNLGTFR